MKVTQEQVEEVLGFIRKLEIERGREPSKVYTRGNCGKAFKLHVYPLPRQSGKI